MEIILAGAALLLAAAIIVTLTLMSGPNPARQEAPEDSYVPTALLNKSELKLLGVLDSCVPEIFGAGARVFAQVSYGEFLKGGSRGAHAKINSKRADFVIANAAGKVLAIVEYQGAGHYGRGDAARARAEASDAAKRKASAAPG